MVRKHQPHDYFAPPRRVDGFTLIELLTVIAIIGILAAIIIPTVGRVRSSAKNAACKNNLRQIGVAVQIYGNENKFYPPSRTALNDSSRPNFLWRQLLRPYMGTNGDPSRQNTETLNSQIIVCPARTMTPVDEATNVRPTYSAHSLVMPDMQDGSPPMRRFGSIPRPTEVILMIDGTQQTNGGSHSNLWSITGIKSAGATNTADNFLTVSNDQDPEGGGYIRYRHSENTTTNTVFVDGHVGQFQKGTMKERNIKINY
jgi:prepilin-type N-terminal cleavage/methylation domain-containing protein/prepilin-type processing-associated H-X9-DG protein